MLGAGEKCVPALANGVAALILLPQRSDISSAAAENWTSHSASRMIEPKLHRMQVNLHLIHEGGGQHLWQRMEKET